MGLDVKKVTCNIRIAAMVLSMAGAFFMLSNANAQDQIRANPNYKAPTELDSLQSANKLFNDNLTNDFNQFLNPHEENDQYIMLTEPESKQKSYVSLGEANETPVPLLQVTHQYMYNPSLSFSLPSIGSNATPGLISSRTGGSQMVVSLNPSRRASTSIDKDKSIKLVLGSSFINTPESLVTDYMTSGLLSQRAYNLSLGLGYSGFRLGASFSRNNFLFSPDMSGFDLGFGYIGGSWSANVSVGAYNSERPLLLSQNYNIFDHISAYELGAAYRLFSNVSLTGRFTYYSYGASNDFASIDDVQSLIFGTNVSF